LAISPSIPTAKPEPGRFNRILSAVLAVAVLGAIGALIYVVTVPKGVDTYTEFYILGLEGKADDYPKELASGEEVTVIVGIVNHEYRTLNYRLEVSIDGTKCREAETIALKNRESWQREVSFAPTRSGDRQKVEFLLYKEGENEAYRSLYLWIDVKDKGN